jgi:iron complex transport system ATP-binding protein
VGAILQLRGVSFAYRGAPVFEHLDLAVDEGQMAAVLGPNGSGKTTLVKLAVGHLGPASGSITLRGTSLTEIAPRERARTVAVVPQESHLAFDFTVREIVLMGRAPHQGMLGIDGEHDRAIALEAMEQTGIADLAGRRFPELSGGERQRVVIARALAQRPRLLLLDEPTAFLDLKHRLSVYALLTRLNRDLGITVVVVSHDINLAARHCARVVLLHRGAIAADGPPDDVLTVENLRSVYGVEVDVRRDPDSGRTYVFPVRPAGDTPP